MDFADGQVIQVPKKYIRLYSFTRESGVYLSARKSYYKNLRIQRIDEGIGLVIKKIKKEECYLEVFNKSDKSDKLIFMLRSVVFSEDALRNIGKADLYEVLVGNKKFIVQHQELRKISKDEKPVDI